MSIRTTAFLLVCLYALSSAATEITGTVCLGENLAKSLDEHTEVHLRIDDSPEIYFERPYNGVPPKVVLTNLDLTQTHTVRIFYKNEVVRSWKFSFQKMNTSSVLIWRGGGAWKMKGNDEVDCVSGT